MKILKIICAITALILCFLFVSYALADSNEDRNLTGEAGGIQKIAVLPFLNSDSEQLAPFVGAIAEMLTTELVKSEKLVAIERTLIKKALEDFPPSLYQIEPVDVGRIAELGKKLGTDILITGRFIESDKYQIDARIYDARNGKLLSQHSVAGDRTQAIALVSELAEKLSKSLIGSKLEQMPPKRMAILYFRNNLSGDYNAFVTSMPTMIQIALNEIKGVSLIEHSEVQKALENSKLDHDGVMNTENAIQLGTRLNADVLVLGSFTMSEGTYELTGMFVDGKTGKIVETQSVKGDERDIMSLPAQLGEKLKTSWINKRIIDLLAMGILEVQFQITYTPMTDRAKHFHICKLFVDGKYVETSKPVKKLNTLVRLFSTQIQSGEHDIEIVHGYVKADGTWLKPFYIQPRKWHVRIDLDAPTIIKYGFHVGWAKDEFRYQ